LLKQAVHPYTGIFHNNIVKTADSYLVQPRGRPAW